jgi:post-segregation antitoxin (ccd killing protein)
MVTKTPVKTKIITLRTNAELVTEAKQLGINISASLHEALKKIVKEERDKNAKQNSTAA